jgi:class 3 adenylate cyclase
MSTPREPMKRKIAAILAADVAGYSRLVAEDEEGTLARLAGCREVFQDFVAKGGGRIFNTAGDAVLAEFPSAVEAVRAAIDIQESMRTRNLGLPPDRLMLFRIGVTIGDVVERGGDLLGDGVNIAARLEGLAAPGGVCVSRGVHEQVANKISVAFRDIGAQEVKNIPQPVHAFVVEMKDGEITRGGRPATRPVAPAGRARRTWIVPASLVGAAVGALVAGLLAFGWRPAPAPSAPAPPPQAAIPPTPSPPPAAPAQRASIELYRDARAFEAQGDAVQARRDYLALAERGEGHIDPLLRLAALIRAQDGRADARALFARLVEKPGGPAAELVHALQFDGTERRRRVEEVAARHADHAPAHFLAAEEASAERLALQTIFDRRAEAAALDAFLAADAAGALSRAFLDPSVGADWLERARRKRAALAPQLAEAATTPRATFTPSNAGWMLSVTPPEAATALFWRLGAAGDFAPTGAGAAPDPRTGKPVPNPLVQLPPGAAGTIEIAYDDAAGRRVGPFPVAFDPGHRLAAFQRDILEQFWTSWLAFGEQGRENLVYYTHLVSHRCGVARAEIAFDDGPFGPLPLPACDVARPYEIPSGLTPWIEAPRGTRSVRARLVYADGATSPERRFERR